MFRSGYLTIGRWRGAPIKLHWSIPLVAVVLSGFSWRPGFLLGFTLLVVIHELGHALLVALLHHRVVAVEVTGLGGACRWSGNASPFEESVIAWGGVLAQLVVWVLAELWPSLVGGPHTWLGAELLAVFTGTNLWLMAINLIPLEPLDGARAWRIVSAWKDRGPGDLPYGTWRDHSRHAGRHWYDRLVRKRKSRRAAAVRPPGDSRDSLADRPLSAEGRRAVDDLIRHATGGVPARRDDDDDGD